MKCAAANVKYRAMMHYSGFRLFRQALSDHKGWPPLWRSATPKRSYDAIIVGGGAHGLATAYYLAKNHGMRNVVVLERGWLGGGNTGRNTTIIRSNYMLDANSRFYEYSLKLWEGLSRDLNFNVMVSQRGVINTAHSDAQMDLYVRRGNWMRLNDIDAELWDREKLRREIPYLDYSVNARFPLIGALVQRRGGTVRHDAVAWGYARGASTLGVDIVENCEVLGIEQQGGRVVGVTTSLGPVAADKVGIAVAGHTTQLAAMAGLKMPIESHVLQAFVSEPLKPVINHVISFGAGHFYISQSDKGGLVFGGDLDGYNSFSQRGNTPMMEHVFAAGMSLMPFLGRIRFVRQWGGVMDMSMDGSPIIARTPLAGFYVNGGWCYGGFKASPASGWTFAHTIAHDAPHDLNAPYTLDRFREGRTIDEKGAGPYPELH